MGNASARLLDELVEAINGGDIQRLENFLNRWGGSSQSRAVQPANSSCFAFLQSNEDAEAKALHALDLNGLLPRLNCTPLQLAARNGNVAAVRLLLHLPSRRNRNLPAVNVNGLDASRRTPLHYAARNSHSQCIADLLARQADPCIAASDDTTPLDVARKVGSTSCVRTIEDRVKLWQGWVDHYEPQLLVFATWTPKWLVVLQDRRPNTGSSSGNSHVQCPSCSSTEKVPPFVAQFACSKCSTVLSVSASSQLALYVPSRSDRNMVLPDTAKPVLTQRLPQFMNQIRASVMKDKTGNIVDFIFKGNIKRALQNTLASERQFGVSLKLLNDRGTSNGEHNFRVATEADRRDLLRILSDPVRAAYEASQQQRAHDSVPQPLPPPSGNASAPGPATPWACPACTFENKAGRTTCEMCGGSRAPDASQLAATADAPELRPSAPPAQQPSSQPSAPGATPDGGAPGMTSQPPPKPSKTSGYELQQPSKTSGYELRPPTAPAAPAVPPGPATAAPPSAPAPAPAKSPEAQRTGSASSGDVDADEDGTCVVCMERAANTAVIPCGHMCACGPCLQDISSSASPQCPLCRGPLTSVIRIYAVG